MCGRYALSIRAAFVRYQLQQHNMPVDEAAEDNETRETYNFAPGYYGLVYRAETAAQSLGSRHHAVIDNEDHPRAISPGISEEKVPKYRLQAMKWGLIPFWTKRNPDYGTLMKTINCRDDSLLDDRGMWTSMKRKKRCIVVAQGFYEWLKKNGGKEKIPYFVKRNDGQLMLFAGLYDSVHYEGSEKPEYTYSIITTDVNKQLSFLHNRMPVILEAGSDALWTWLDPRKTQWSGELQSLLSPYKGDLECYAVSKDVGKVGNNSPEFIIPVASSQNKKNIANFFSAPASKVKGSEFLKSEQPCSPESKKRPLDHLSELSPSKAIKHEAEASPTHKPSPAVKLAAAATKQTRSAVSNGMKPKVVEKDAAHGNRKITSFFGKT